MNAILLTLCLLLTQSAAPVFSITPAWLQTLMGSNPLARDAELNARRNTIVTTTITVDSVTPTTEFKKSWRIRGRSAGSTGTLTLWINIYTSNPEYETILEQGSSYDFRGQCVFVTPLSVRRDAYVMDVILEDGALVVE